MTAEKMFNKLSYHKEVKDDCICFSTSCFNENYKVYICFDLKNKITCMYCWNNSNKEIENTVLYLDNDLLKAINKQIEELGWI